VAGKSGIVLSPEPYFKESHHAWYVDIHGRPVRLASEEEGEEAAYTQYDKLMAGQQPIKDHAYAPVVAILKCSLDYHQSKSAARTHQFCRNALDSFAHDIGPKLWLADLRPVNEGGATEEPSRQAKVSYRGKSRRATSRTRLSPIQRIRANSVAKKSNSDPRRPRRRATSQPTQQLAISPSELAIESP
jgi:hypothetical protein